MTPRRRKTALGEGKIRKERRKVREEERKGRRDGEPGNVGVV